MKIRTALTALVVIGMVGFAATSADAQCKSSEKAKAGCSAQQTKSGCTVQQTKAGCSAQQTKADCTAHAKGGCSAECMKTCGGAKACNYTEAECAKKIREHYQSRGWLGIEMNMDTGQPAVTRVTAGSPAEAAGFQVGDVLTSLNGIPYGQGNEAAIAEMTKNGFGIGDAVVYTANRDGQIVKLEATLAKISDEGLARMIAFHNESMQHKPLETAEKTDK